MKRSEINANLHRAKTLFAEQKFILPRWAYWPPEEWQNVGPEAREIRDCMLGWDITDFGSGNFYEVGLTLFTIRNGNPADPANRKSYAEKIMMVQVNQVTPMHFHFSKMEDIINRGGGDLVLQLYHATEDEQLDEKKEVQVSIDGFLNTLSPGDTVRLKPGESITLPQRLYHKFWADGADCMVGEVSMTNDDTHDNRFHEPLGRFPEIEEDVAPLHLLCNEYPEF